MAKLPAASPILFIHGSISSRRMWLPYEAALTGREIISVDLPGYGDAPALESASPARLSDVVNTIRPAITGKRFIDVVAHSFGGAVAIRLALEEPSRVRTLTLVEPTCFPVLCSMGERVQAARAEIEAIGLNFSSTADPDQRFAMARFVDYWNGRGSWAALRPDRQQALLLKAGQVRRDFEALSGERLQLAAYRKLVTPTLIVTGTASPAAALLAAEGLTRAAPRASSITVRGAGHMLPMTHAPELTAIIRDRAAAEVTRLVNAA